MANLSAASFPDLQTKVQGKWAPILLRPLLDSPEQLVIGVVAEARGSLHLEPANELDRLACLYERRARELIFASKVCLNSVREQLLAHETSLDELRAPASGVEIGPTQDAVGQSAAHIAQFWMQSLSSLYRVRDARALILAPTREVADLAPKSTPADLVPSEVLAHVIRRNPLLRANFSPDIALGRRRRSSSVQVLIDYRSPRLTANFDVLPAKARMPAMHRIVKRMWDLEIERDRNRISHPDHYEMLVEYPALELKTISQPISARVTEMLRDLESQADERQIRLRPFPNTREMGNHILETEGFS